MPVNDTRFGIPGARGGAGFRAQWGYQGFFYAFMDELLQGNNAAVNMTNVARVLAGSIEGARVLFTENHDTASNQNQGRIPAIVDPNGDPAHPSYWAAKKAMMGVAAIVVAPGVPMLLQGQECLSYATFEFPVPPPFNWARCTQNAGIVQEVADLLALRTAIGSGLAGAHSSVLQVIDTASEKLLVLLRWDAAPAAGTLAVFNFLGNNVSTFRLRSVPADGVWYVRFNGDRPSYFPLYHGFGAYQTHVTVAGGASLDYLQVPAYSVLLLSRN